MKDLNGNIIKLTKIEIILMSIFVIMCGFPNSEILPYKTLVILLISVPFLIKGKVKIDRSLVLFLSSFLLVFLLQKYYFGVVSSQSLQLIYSAWFVCTLLGEKFKYAYFKAIYILCVIAIPCYMLMQINLIPNIGFLNNDAYKGIFVWSVRWNEIIRNRNCGPFWEPGAFAGNICVLLLLFFNDLGELWRIYKRQMIVIYIALFTTFSTQGYLVFFFIYLFYFYREKMKSTKIISLAVVLFVAYTVAMNIPFIGEKVQEQFNAASDIESKEGSTSLSRFSTTALDLYYISKHPIIGNTTTPSIRYADHPYLQSVIEYEGGYGTGSGVTDFIATFGLLPFGVWLFFTGKRFQKAFGQTQMILCVILLLTLGNAECYFTWILYNSLPFMKLGQMKNKSI